MPKFRVELCILKQVIGKVGFSCLIVESLFSPKNTLLNNKMASFSGTFISTQQCESDIRAILAANLDQSSLAECH